MEALRWNPQAVDLICYLKENKIKGPKNVTDSEFHMWRALLAFSMIDRLMTVEKRHFLLQAMKNSVLSDAQKKIFIEDMTAPKDIEWLFIRIKEYAHQRKFCDLARSLTDLTHFDSAYEEAKAVLAHLEHLIGQDGRLFAEANGATQTACQLYEQSSPIASFQHAKSSTTEVEA